MKKTVSLLLVVTLLLTAVAFASDTVSFTSKSGKYAPTIKTKTSSIGANGEVCIEKMLGVIVCTIKSIRVLEVPLPNISIQNLLEHIRLSTIMMDMVKALAGQDIPIDFVWPTAASVHARVVKLP